MKILFIGHVCIDKNVVRGEAETLYGGGVVQAGITAQRLSAQSFVVTKCAEPERSNFHLMGEVGVRVTFLPTPACTSIRNVYPSENPDDRQSFLISRAEPFSEEDLEVLTKIKADVVHINPLWFGEFPSALLAGLKPRVPMLCADAQGFLRFPEPDGRLVHRDFSEKQELLPLLDLFKVDSKEALLLTGETNPQRAARAVHTLGPKLVLLTHRDGACVFDGLTFHESPFGSYSLEGRTGRGDTCTASFLVARLRGLDLPGSLQFAADITTRKMQYRGPYRG